MPLKTPVVAIYRYKWMKIVLFSDYTLSKFDNDFFSDYIFWKTFYMHS